MHAHQMTPAAALPYILAGHGTITLVGKTTRYTFTFGMAKDGKDAADAPIFARLLIAPEEYAYLGFIKHGRLIAGKKGHPNHPAFKALAWYLDKAAHQPHVAAQAECWHAGTCGRCGRELTVPASIENGLGPICAGKEANKYQTLAEAA